MQKSISFIVQVATVALIVIASRWLFGARGAALPRTRDGNSIYGIKWQWRAVGLAGGAFWIIVSIWSWHDQHSRPDGVLIAITIVFLTVGLWLASGSVTTNQTGITKRVLWLSRSFTWKDITEVRVHKKQGGAIELRSGSRKLIIDSRFVGSQHLLNEIEDHTQLQPIGAS
jgi:hypothetical protein